MYLPLLYLIKKVEKKIKLRKSIDNVPVILYTSYVIKKGMIFIKLQLIKILESTKGIEYFFNKEENIFIVIIQNFVGFNKGWEEVFQPVKDNGLINYLNCNGKLVDNEFVTYQLADCKATLSYTSEDI